MEATKKPSEVIRDTSVGKYYPLFLNYSFPVMGNGFLTSISMRGRLLMEEVNNEFWIYGVNPGGFCVSAKTKDAALNSFTARLHEVMNDAAEAAESFPAFKNEILESFETNEEYEELWKTALQCVREGKTNLEMNRENGDVKESIKVDEIAKPNPGVNISTKRVTLATNYTKAA